MSRKNKLSIIIINKIGLIILENRNKLFFKI